MLLSMGIAMEPCSGGPWIDYKCAVINLGARGLGERGRVAGARVAGWRGG